MMKPAVWIPFWSKNALAAGYWHAVWTEGTHFAFMLAIRSYVHESFGHGVMSRKDRKGSSAGTRG